MREQARLAALRAWLGSQQRTRQIVADSTDAKRRLVAYRTFWGWLPAAVIVYWIAYILTRWVVFASTGEIPEYYVAILGTKAGQSQTMYYQTGSVQKLKFDRHPEMRTLRVMSPSAGPSSCSLADNGGSNLHALPASAVAIRTTDTMTYIEVSLDGLASSESIVCTVDWKPHADSFTTSSIDVHNGGDWPALPSSLTSEDVVLNLSWLADENDVEVFSPSAKRGIDDKERVLSADTGAIVRWTSPERSAWRDIIFVVIGALIAFGAAILLEALRHQIELSIHHGTGAPS
ncbi:MAG: hypothetical protein JO194_07650 [Candidatus Eremiobacteraeota bacterium]|nr:hypothetical protein [Candidatus Eremiobacteraeota bacterium]